MDFEFTEEQVQLRNSLRSYLTDKAAFADMRRTSRAEPGWDPEIWRDFATRLGIVGTAIGTPAGGLGGGAVDIMVIMEELGERLVPVPFLETAIIGAALLEDGGNREAELQAIVTGEARYALAWAEPGGRYNPAHVELEAVRTARGWSLKGVKSVVAAAPWATHLLVTARTAGESRERGGVSLFLVDARHAQLFMSVYPTIDGRRAADVSFNDVEVDRDAIVGDEGLAIDAIEAALDTGIAAIGAEAVGVMRRLVQDTIDYCKTRRQFGKPLSDFQALQHRMVDMFMHLEMATSAVYLATLNLDAPPLERAKACSAAKITIGQACRFIGQNAVQLHGGMGMTDELAIGHYFKRATVIESEFGSTDYHLARFASLSGQAQPGLLA